MRGRKRLPTALHMLRGNPGKRPLPTNEPTPEALPATVDPPPWLDKVAREEWKRLAPLLADNGLLTVLDADALAMYCRAFASWREATDKIAVEGSVLTSRNGYPVVSAWINVAAKNMITMRSLMTEFGLTPSARARVSRATPKLDASNPLDKFIRRR